MGILQKLARRAVDSKTARFVEVVRTGWNSYSFLFYIGGVAAILGGIFGVAGLISIVITLLLFFYAGRFKEEYEKEKNMRKGKAARKR